MELNLEPYLTEDEKMWVREWSRKVVAQNSNTPGEIPAILARYEDSKINEKLAENPNTPRKTLTFLANDEDWFIRMYVAQNRNSPREALAILARDKAWNIRVEVAGNPNTPREILANDEFRLVRTIVADRLKTTKNSYIIQEL